MPGLFDDLSRLKADLMPLHTTLGNPLAVVVTVTKGTQSITFTALKNEITYKDSQWLMSAGVRANNEQLSLTDIPSHLYGDVMKGGIYSFGGESYRLLNLYESGSVSYRAILERQRLR